MSDDKDQPEPDKREQEKPIIDATLRVSGSSSLSSKETTNSQKNVRAHETYTRKPGLIESILNGGETIQGTRTVAERTSGSSTGENQWNAKWTIVVFVVIFSGLVILLINKFLITDFQEKKAPAIPESTKTENNPEPLIQNGSGTIIQNNPGTVVINNNLVPKKETLFKEFTVSGIVRFTVDERDLPKTAHREYPKEIPLSCAVSVKTQSGTAVGRWQPDNVEDWKKTLVMAQYFHTDRKYYEIHFSKKYVPIDRPTFNQDDITSIYAVTVVVDHVQFVPINVPNYLQILNPLGNQPPYMAAEAGGSFELNAVYGNGNSVELVGTGIRESIWEDRPFSKTDVKVYQFRMTRAFMRFSEFPLFTGLKQ